MNHEAALQAKGPSMRTVEMPLIEEQQRAQDRLRILSLQLPYVGHVTYGKMLRRVFAESPNIEMVASWTDERREIPARLLAKIMYPRFPLEALRKRNLDFSRERREFGLAYFGRRLLDRLVPTVRPDVLHFHTQTPALLALRYIREIPTVISTDQSGVQAGEELMPSARWTHDIGVRMERAPLRAAAAIIVFSQWNKDSMVAAHGIAPEKIHIIPPSIDASVFDGSPRRDRSPLRLLFVGANFVRKGGPLLVDTFIERFAERDVELHIVTTEPNIRRHPKVIVHYGVEAHSPQWKRLYEETDVFVLPTNYDAFGIAYIEAMAAGLPVIGTGTNAGPEIIADGESGYLIAPGDARALADRIGRLLDDPALRHGFGARGRVLVAEKYDQATNAARLEALFLSVARSGPLHSPIRSANIVSAGTTLPGVLTQNN